MKTNELTGAALDWAVASSKGYSKIALTISGEVREFIKMHSEGYHNYSTDWAQGGPIIEREKISVIRNIGGSWRGSIRHTTSHPLVSHPVLDGWTNQHGQTPLIAAMRCYVASKLGNEVDVPKELV